MMYLEKKLKISFITNYYFKQKNNKKFDAVFFFPFSMVASLPPNASATAMYQFRFEFDQKK